MFYKSFYLDITINEGVYTININSSGILKMHHPSKDIFNQRFNVDIIINNGAYIVKELSTYFS
jgi:hypothetical protein